ncbi:MAG: homocysteine S-methyltransferase [Rhodospirillaceae bacterium]|jgi:S-methylmethionine-dependent homocysteine/selenocysteine methylase|nr:homocysteine S-methyltransferase [Rhodospirillaceae bacterium]MBT4486780.1 homocysteine S-methyltransferase [Rhodospirillaceae bacterium]MBT5193186.1 homocysteine S-methyltransferase [Rhodospirillaceae bacterium]MBT5896210.1 homocysteine S-methyltransferase [Rhodospirillaceae bacterium]MBT6428945.1 homocysteine S-methyltransferase [Rhodospirillaceae bacterium]
MTKYRTHPPQLDGGLFLTDSGLETILVFHENLELPHFAAFDLLREQSGTATLRNYYRTHAATARDAGVGFILEAPTWRANPDWGAKLGYSPEALDAINLDAVALMEEMRGEFEMPETPMVISGQIGPRGDGYDPGEIMSVEEAQAYHDRQIAVFARTNADMITALTITNTAEAIGITKAAQAAAMPVVIGFTVETDGCLPTGQTLADAIKEVDDATASGPIYYMVNCAHPSHFEDKLADGGDWKNRLRGLRCNASRCSHAELDEATELDAGDPVQLAAEYRDIVDRLPHINVFGGCCGTDHRHIEQISTALQIAA